MTPYNEAEVLELIREESTQRKGFEMIVAEYGEQLYWQIRRMVLSHEDANDLLQNTFVKAWTNIDYFRAEAKLSTWLYRITHGIQPAILPGDEIRRHVRDIRHVGRGVESLLPSCGKENREVFERSGLNLLKRIMSKEHRGGNV